tara:strand:+ start:148 stop:711 length:564 start_codon:yes stop_codon:yes gene_type:complete
VTPIAVVPTVTTIAPPVVTAAVVALIAVGAPIAVTPLIAAAIITATAAVPLIAIATTPITITITITPLVPSSSIAAVTRRRCRGASPLSLVAPARANSVLRLHVNAARMRGCLHTLPAVLARPRLQRPAAPRRCATRLAGGGVIVIAIDAQRHRHALHTPPLLRRSDAIADAVLIALCAREPIEPER